MVAVFTDMVADGEGTIALTAVCPLCGKPSTVTGVDTEGFQRWIMGEPVQSALPDLTPGQREVLQTGYHDACYDLDFPDA